MHVETELLVRRWARYGKVRLYVTDGVGRPVGWVDELTGVATLDVPALEAAFDAAIAAYRRLTEAPTAGEQSPSEARPSEMPEPAAPVATAAWEEEAGPAGEPEVDPLVGGALPGSELPVPPEEDLALRRPGEMARGQAEAERLALRDQGKVRAFLLRAMDAKTDERAWRVGAAGEETVGQRLARLESRGWRVLHAVPVGERGSDIDHVLIGPGGVFTLNTKTHPGANVWVGARAIMVNGHKQPYLRNSRFEAQRASKLLTEAMGRPINVGSALVILTDTFVPNLTIKQQPEGVVVLHRLNLVRHFAHRQGVLSPTEVEAIYDLARRPSTWVTGSPPAPSPGV